MRQNIVNDLVMSCLITHTKNLKALIIKIKLLLLQQFFDSPNKPFGIGQSCINKMILCIDLVGSLIFLQLAIIRIHLFCINFYVRKIKTTVTLLVFKGYFNKELFVETAYVSINLKLPFCVPLIYRDLVHNCRIRER